MAQAFPRAPTHIPSIRPAQWDQDADGGSRSMLISEQLRGMLVCQGLVGQTLVVTSDPVSQPGLKQQGWAGPEDVVWSPGPGITEEQVASESDSREEASLSRRDGPHICLCLPPSDMVSYNPGWTRACYEAGDSLELPILLPQPPGCPMPTSVLLTYCYSCGTGY